MNWIRKGSHYQESECGRARVCAVKCAGELHFEAFVKRGGKWGCLVDDAGKVVAHETANQARAFAEASLGDQP